MKNILKIKKAIRMPLVKVLRNGQVTLPKEYRMALGIDEGQILEVGLTQSSVILKPKTLIDEGGRFSLKGEKKIREAIEDIRKGRVKKFNTIDSLIKDLNS